MDWLKDILKDLAISKTLVVAIFITAVFMYFGPVLAPTHVPALKDDLVPYLFAGMVLTGCLLALWGIAGIFSALRAGLQKIATALKSSKLDNLEIMVLLLLAKNPTDPINLDYIDYAKARSTKLMFHQVAKGLQGKGLVHISDWDRNVIFLTEKGQKRALAIQHQAGRAKVS